MKLASTGSVVAISDQDKKYENRNQAGIVKVLEYNAFTNKWKQIGDGIIGDGYYHRLGLSMGISSDGSVLAVAGYIDYPARVYKYNNNNNNNNNGWQQIGEDINSDGVGYWYDLSLSSSGSVLVVAYSNIVKVLTYDKLTNKWLDSSANFPAVNYTYISYGIVGRYPIIAASADAVTVAAKADDKVDVYRLESQVNKTSNCKGDQFYFNFTIQPDQFPDDISWLL